MPFYASLMPFYASGIGQIAANYSDHLCAPTQCQGTIERKKMKEHYVSVSVPGKNVNKKLIKNILSCNVVFLLMDINFLNFIPFFVKKVLTNHYK